jgi:hypothetical protein
MRESLETQPGSEEAMQSAKKVLVNGYPAIETNLDIGRNGFSYARSAIGKMPSTDEYAWLMGILEGQTVRATVFSGTNVVGHTNTEQLRKAFASLNPAYGFWIKEPQLEKVIEQFGDSTLGFSMSGIYCKQTPAQIESFLAAVHDEDVLTDEAEFSRPRN